MSQPRTVKRIVVVEKTLGQIFHEAANPTQPWNMVSTDVKRCIEVGAAALASAVEGDVSEHVAKEIDAISALLPHLRRAEDVDDLAAWLKDLREAIVCAKGREAELHLAIGVDDHSKAMQSVRSMSELLNRYVEESYASQGAAGR